MVYTHPLLLLLLLLIWAKPPDLRIGACHSPKTTILPQYFFYGRLDLVFGCPVHLPHCVGVHTPSPEFFPLTLAVETLQATVTVLSKRSDYVHRKGRCFVS